MIKKILTDKELFWTFVYQLITLVGGLLLIKILATTLSTETYGYYTLIMSISALVIMLPFSALMQGVSRYISIYKKKEKYNNFFIVVIILNFFIISLYIIFAIIFKNIYELSDTWNDIYYMVVLFSISEIFKVLFRTINNTNRERKNLSLSISLEFSLKIGLLFLVYFYTQISIKYILLILVLSNILSVWVMISKYRNLFTIKYLSLKQFKVYTLRIWVFATPLIVWAIFGWLRDMSNRWYLDYFLDKEQVALFAMISSIAMVAPTALSGLIGGFIIPILYQKDNSDKSYVGKFLLKTMPLVLFVFLLSFMVTYIFKNEIILIIADEKYLELSWMLPWMFLTFCIYTLSMMATYEIFAHKQTKKLIWSSIIPGIISIVCGYFFIKFFGVEGALYNYIITYLSYALLTFYIVIKYTKSNKLKRLLLDN